MEIEIEMKAKVNEDQIKKLIEFFDFETTYLEKSDEYFSFDGIVPKKPKNIIRIRKEKEVYLSKVFYNGSKDSKDLLGVLKGEFKIFNYEKPQIESTFLTVKKKSTDASGIETNEETEGELDFGSENAFRKSMEITNFKIYFTKFKRSISFYVTNKEEDKNRFKMHAELVSVNRVGSYLEIESIVESAEEKDLKEAADQIRWFFEYELGIKEFDKRSWQTIIEEEV